MGNVPGVNYAACTEPFNNAMTQAGATTFLRAAHFIAQMGHESGGLRWLEELHDGSNYEGRKDLGNTRPGDGRRFKGRGIVQVTGRYNYGRFSQWANSKGLVNSPTFFVDNPAQVASPRWAFLVAAWYWSAERPNLNAQADSDNLDAVTRSINGGTNGLADRRQRLARAKQLGDAILPTKGGTVGLNYYTVEPHATLLTSSYTAGRNGKTINCIYRHHMAGNLNLQQCVNMWNTSGTSAHYTVNSTGGIGQAVYDSNTAWATGNTDGNQRGISIEHANITRQVGGSDSNKGSWNISDATIINGARLAAALCLYYKLGRPVYGKNIKDHRDVRQTFCPGHLANGGMYHKKWMDEAQSFYDKLVAKSVHPDGTPKTGTVPTAPATKEDSMTPAQEKLLREVHFQLLNEWPQLGNQTLVDAVARLSDQVYGYEKDEKGNYKYSGWPGIDGNGGKTLIEAVAEIQKAVVEKKEDK